VGAELVNAVAALVMALGSFITAILGLRVAVRQAVKEHVEEARHE